MSNYYENSSMGRILKCMLREMGAFVLSESADETSSTSSAVSYCRFLNVSPGSMSIGKGKVILHNRLRTIGLPYQGETSTETVSALAL